MLFNLDFENVILFGYMQCVNSMALSVLSVECLFGSNSSVSTYNGIP